MKAPERFDAVNKCILGYSCLGVGHWCGQCKVKRLCGKNGCQKNHNRLLHSDDKHWSPKAEPATKESEQANPVVFANPCSGKLQTVALGLSHEIKICDTLVVCDTGSTLSFVDETLKKELDLQGSDLTPNIAGINRTKQMKSEKINVKVSFPNISENVTFHVHPSMLLGSKC